MPWRSTSSSHGDPPRPPALPSSGAMGDLAGLAMSNDPAPHAELPPTVMAIGRLMPNLCEEVETIPPVVSGNMPSLVWLRTAAMPLLMRRETSCPRSSTFLVCADQRFGCTNGIAVPPEEDLSIPSFRTIMFDAFLVSETVPASMRSREFAGVERS